MLGGIDGLLKYDLNPPSFTVTATFDDTKVSLEEIVERLSSGGYPVSGKPQ